MAGGTPKEALCLLYSWIDNPPWADQDCAPSYPVYKMSDPALGVNVRRWLQPPDAVAHAPVATIWTGVSEPTTGFPNHVNPPTSQTVEADFNVSGPDDQIEAWAWVDIPQNGFLRDNNTNTGELGEVWIAPCCQPPVRQPGYAETINTGVAGTDRFVMATVPISAGMHLVYFRGSDLSANQGINIEYSVNGVNNWSQPEWVSELPTVECEIVDGCDPVPAGYELCYPEQCKPVIPPPVSPTLEVEYCGQVLCDELYSGFRGQINQVTATDFNTDVLGWIVEDPSFTVPCDGCFHVEFELPWVRSMVRDSFLQAYFDFRLMVNGSPVQTITHYTLLEHNQPNSAEESAIHYQNQAIEIDWSRGMNAGDQITVEWQARARRSQVGDSPYTRLLVYRSRLVVIGVPRDVVTGVDFA